ncbi:MAG: copper homeostasis protein CutC [Verrucomicrobia bacterium]|jgi:copper homeostasis protein|nr:copper homeostasis protein CutC [Verrucomicrobiota bacterium]
MIKTEICINSPESAVAAQNAGADRVELCANLLEGGTTPSIGAVQTARSRVNIGLHVIVRPRGGDFLFNDFEIETMKQDIEAMKQIGVDGIVLGSLTQDGEIDVPQTRALIERARPLSVTFHRAFDMCHDPIQSLETLIELGVDRLLTSGQEESVIEGIDLIRELQQRAKDRIIIMPGGGITPRNLTKLVEYTGVKEVHFAAMKTVSSEMVFRNDRVYMGGTLRPPEYESQVADEKVIATMRTSLQS